MYVRVAPVKHTTVSVFVSVWRCILSYERSRIARILEYRTIELVRGRAFDVCDVSSSPKPPLTEYIVACTPGHRLNSFCSAGHNPIDRTVLQVFLDTLSARCVLNGLGSCFIFLQADARLINFFIGTGRKMKRPATENLAGCCNNCSNCSYFGERHTHGVGSSRGFQGKITCSDDGISIHFTSGIEFSVGINRCNPDLFLACLRLTAAHV